MQQSLDRPRPQQQRTMTLGPGAPIHDWEVERVTILAEHKEYRERAERLEKQIQQDRETYERNTASLLREVKMKEGLWEKRVQDIERNMMQEIEMLQRQLEKQHLEYTEELQEARKRHDDALDTEQKKHERRLAALQERLNAKDAELAQLKTDGALQEDDNPKYQKEIAEWKSRCEAQQKEIDELKKSLEEKPQITDERIIQLETQLQTVEQGHKAKLQNMVENHESEMQRMRELFMNENHQIAMQHEARLDNMRSDYEAILAETREQFEAEKEVWQIERQTAVDQALRKAQLSHEDAIKELERTWNNKLQDMQASMSKDASDIQKHWQGKLDEADAAFKTQVTRLKGEIEVVKDRLGKEIDRRRRLQEREKYAQEKAAKLETEVKQLQRQLYNTQEDYRAAYKLAQHLMSLSSVDNTTSKSYHDQLPDLLQCCLRNVSTLLSEKTMDTMTELRYF